MTSSFFAEGRNPIGGLEPRLLSRDRGQVLTVPTKVPLNPMSSRERRIVHLAVKDIPGVRTQSVGLGEERQVVIHPADSQPKK